MSTQSINQTLMHWQDRVQRALEPLLTRLSAISARNWQRSIVVVLGAAMLADAARLIWLALPQHSAPPMVAMPINAISTSAGKVAQSADIEKMVGWHLFGEVGAQPRAAAAVVEEQAQDTTLNLQLLGVISASDPSQARAFVMADGRQQQFAIGERMPGPGKVMLNKVLVDRAIIDNNGRYETLWLYDPNSAAQSQMQQPVATPASATVDMRDNAAVSQLAQTYRNQLYQNPGSLADIIQVAPASENGKLIGYRINPGRDPAQFAKFGLKPGDVVTMINDVRLDDPQRALELYNLLRTQNQASITVHRGNEDVVLMVSLQNGGDAN